MCGLSGVLTFSRDSEADSATLATIHRHLTHRGPDGQGFLRVDTQLQATFSADRQPPVGPPAARLLLGFHWLKIQDLDPRSLQPMGSPDGKTWLTFNGEIYNFRELRTVLQQQGHSFQTDSDSEVVLHAYREWGTDCFQKFVGMWALIIVDLREQSLVLSRDRLGIKPLFYRKEGSRWMFASESQALAAAAEAPHPDLDRITEFLNGRPPHSADRTFFRDITPVPAGSFAVCSLHTPADQISFQLYWELPLPSADSTLSYSEAQQRFEQLLRESVREHLPAQVGLGMLLSGGLDSSAIAGIASQLLRADQRPLPHACSVVFEDPEMSEWPFIQLVLSKLAIPGKNVVLNGSLVKETLDQVVQGLGRPLLGQDMIAQYCAYRLTRQNGCKVVLDGQGADELLGGLPLYEAQMFLSMLQNMQWFTLIKELRIRANRYRTGFGQNVKTFVLKPIFRGRGDQNKYAELLGLRAADEQRISKPPDSGSQLTRFLHHQVTQQNLPTVLEQQDHNAMRHGVESRVPFLDHRIAELAFQLPDDFKIHDGVRKRILLDSVRPLLPEAVTRRTDKKMFISKSGWLDLRRLFGPELREAVASKHSREMSFWDGAKVAKFVDAYLNGSHDDAGAVWRIFTTCRWAQIHRVN